MINFRSIKGFQIWTALLLCTGCASAAYHPTITPQSVDHSMGLIGQGIVPIGSFPGVVKGLVVADGKYVLASTELCLVFNQVALWEPGDNWDSAKDLPSIEVEIDNQKITNYDILALGPAISELGDDGTTLGRHGSTFSYCFQPQIGKGDHAIDVKISKSKAKTSSYQWDFRKE